MDMKINGMDIKVNDEDLKWFLSFMGENYYFFLEKYKDIFLMTPLEFAKVINGMGEHEFFEFKSQIEFIEGHTTDLINEKITELKKYAPFNADLGEALVKIIGVKTADDLKLVNEMYSDKEKRSEIVTAYEVLFFVYPEFRKHFLKLKTAGIISEREIVEGENEYPLKWNRDKISIAEYFEHLECKERNRRWKYVEDIFGYDKLCQYLNVHKEQQRKPSRAFEEIKLLLGIKDQ
jgi:YHS domain-containing protein